MRRGRTGWLVLASLGVLAVGVSLALLGSATALEWTVPPGWVVEGRPRPTPDAVEWARLKQEAKADYDAAKARGEVTTRYTSGPTTRGSTIGVAGRSIRLPDDTWVEQETAFVHCVVGLPCPETPLYRLRRGQSIIEISGKSGVIYEEKTVPGEERAFDFLKEALR